MIDIFNSKRVKELEWDNQELRLTVEALRKSITELNDVYIETQGKVNTLSLLLVEMQAMRKSKGAL